jgi:4-amino-4-deoxy-L-arabinose transferase-like glycosyltransferase
VLAQGALGEIHRAGGRGTARWSALFWIAEAAAVLVKGPVAPGLALLTAVALGIADRDWRWLRGLAPLWGVPLFVLLVVPWFIAITAATGGAFLEDAAGRDFFGKLVSAQESHGAWPGYYLLLLPVTFWPGSLLLGVAGACAWRARGDPAVRFLIAWAVPFWLVLELVPTKLPHYLLPVFPALALLTGRAVLDGVVAPAAWLRRASCGVWAAASLVVVAALAVAPYGLTHGIDAAGIAACVVILVYGGATLRLFWREIDPVLAVRMVLLALLVLPVALALEAPRLDPIWLSRDAAEMVARYRPPPGLAVASVGYAEPSLVFLLGTRTVFATPEDAADRLTSARGAVALVEGREDDAFQKALLARGWQAQLVERVAGLDYSNGKRMVLTLYRGVPG